MPRTDVAGWLSFLLDFGSETSHELSSFTGVVRFTTCEFYMAYADYEQMMNITEENWLWDMCFMPTGLNGRNVTVTV